MSIVDNSIMSTSLSDKILKALRMAIAVNYLLYRYHIINILNHIYDVNLYQVANCSSISSVELRKIQNLITKFIKLKEIQKIILNLNLHISKSLKLNQKDTDFRVSFVIFCPRA